MAETEWSTITPEQGESPDKIEIEIEGAEEEVVSAAPEVEVEKQAKPAPTPEVEAEEDTATAEVEEEASAKEAETSGAQKRIRQLVKQKKEREAQIEELLQAQKDMQVKLQQREEEYGTLLNTNVESNERQVTERIELAKSAYKEALDSGESDRILQAQEALTNAQQDSYNIKTFKQEAESFKPINFEEQEQQLPVNKAADRKAQRWVTENDWFNKDRVLTAAALEIDSEVQGEGFDPADDDYYEEINRRMADNFPNKFGTTTEEVAADKPRTKPTSTASQVVAGASHTSASPSNKKVKLSQEDVRLAQKWGITLEQYAAEKLKVESAGDGEYTTINR
jgi:hypothetical protein